MTGRNAAAKALRVAAVIQINQTVHYFITYCVCLEYETGWRDIPPFLPANLNSTFPTVIC